MFILKLSGRTSMELSDTYRSFEEQLQRSLELLDGDDHFSLLLFHVPDGAGWPDGPGFNAADYEEEYLQSAGRAGAMVVEIRRSEDDGQFHQYAVGRPVLASSGPAVEINWQQNFTIVPANEVFDAHEAATIFLHYFRCRTVPKAYTLRELDLRPPTS